jgi:FAD/FMN-containing dehydrogenase
MQSSPTAQPSPTSADWSALAKNLQGTLVRPGDAQYATSLQLFSPRFDNMHPQGIAYCTSASDVQACLAFVRKFAIPFAIRSGGHSYPGYSTTNGLIVDVTRMNGVTVNGSTATVSAGARLIDVYAALMQRGLVLPAGSCPTVGIAGLALGGGAGVLGRKFGLTCDNLLSAQIVTADGRLLTCDTQHNADLFWALRGGGGGNFGVSTSFTFRVYPLTNVSLFTYRWPWSSAAAVVSAWQQWSPNAPDELWSSCLLQATSNKSADPIVQINGAYVGSIAALQSLIGQLTSKIGTAPVSNYVWSAGTLDAMLYEAGCYNKTVNQCHLPSQNSQGIVQRDMSSVKSDYFTTLLPQAAIHNLVNAVAARHASPVLSDGGIGMDSLGGAINRVAPDATAFVHRNALFSAQYSGSWHVGDPASTVDANRAWLTSTWQSMRSYASGQAYQNYMDPDLPNWQQAYYDSNYARLQQVKKTYDVDNFFHFAQGITPA